MCLSFRQTLFNNIKDGVLDKQEFQALKQKSAEVKKADPDSQDAFDGEQLINFLDDKNSSMNITYSLPKEGSSDGFMELKFEFTPTYSEKEKVAGNNIAEAISNISQNDTIKETKSDGSRCGAATLLNIAMRSLAEKSPGKSPEEIFSVIAKKAGVPTSFTYENVHKAQDKLYNYANNDKEDGLTAEYNLNYEKETGNIKSAKTEGEAKKLGDFLGLKMETLIGPNINNLSDKKVVIDNFFDKNPKGSIMVGVHLADDGKITASAPNDTNKEQNHFVEIYKTGDGFYMKDTGAVSNGGSTGSDTKLEGDEIKNELLYKNPGATVGVTRP